MDQDDFLQRIIELSEQLVLIAQNHDTMLQQQIAINTNVSATLARLEAFITKTENNGR